MDRRSKWLAGFALLAIALVVLAFAYLSVGRGAGGLAPSTATAAGPVESELGLVPASGTAEDGDAREIASGRAATEVDPSGTTSEPPRLRGVVLDENEKPVPGAEVALVLRPAGDFSTLIDWRYIAEEQVLEQTTTDARGAFAFEVEHGHAYDVRVRAAGCGEARVANAGAGPPIEIRLARAAELVLRAVRKRDGAPIANALVALLREDDSRTPETRTDAGGTARLTGLAPGSVHVQVIPEVEARGSLELDLVAGQVHVADVELGDGHAITGIVREAGTGRPIGGAEVSAWSFYAKTATCDPFGAYRITGIDPGGADSIVVAARALGFGRLDRHVALATGVESSVDFELVPAFAVRGRIVDSDGAPIDGAYVAAIGAGRDPRPTTSPNPAPTRDHVATRSRSDGRFELGDASRETSHALFVRARGRGTRTFDLPAPALGSASIDLGDLALARGAAVEGRASSASGAPIGGGLVLLRDLGVAPIAASALLGQQHLSTDGHGRFRAADLAAGRHLIRLVASGYPNVEVEVALDEGRVLRDVELVTGAGGVVAGQVVDSGGVPVADAEVRVTGPDGPRWIGRGRTDGAGAFRIEGLPDVDLALDAQRYDPVVRADGALTWLLASEAAVVRPGTTDLVITLPAADPIEGEVLASDGTALVGGCVEAFDAEGRPAGQACAREGRFRLLVRSGTTVRLVGFRRIFGADGRVSRVDDGDEHAIVEGVQAGSRGVVVRFAKKP